MMSSTALAKETKSHTGQQETSRLSSYRIEYQPQLVEEAVLRAIAGHAEERIFRRERDAIYSLGDEEAREESFQTVHQRWFEHIGLHEPLEEVLTCWPLLRMNTHRCLIVKASGKKEVGAELFVAEDDLGRVERAIKSIVVQLPPDLLVRPEPLHNFLRRELLHVVDMLDPEFGYEPNLPKSDIGPTYDRLLQERYRVLWDLTIAGRLVQDGWLHSSAKHKHWAIFHDTFSGPTEDLEKVFSFFFNNQSPHHQELVSFCFAPETWFVDSKSTNDVGRQCSLCQLPSFHLIRADTSLSRELIDQIKEQHPHWQSSQRICLQCRDLYESRLYLHLRA